MNAVQGDEITLGTTSPVRITLTDVPFNDALTFFVKVTTATTGVKVAVESIPANAKAWGTSDTVPPISCYNGSLILQGAATDKVVIGTSKA